MTASTAYDGAFNLKSLAATVTGVPTLSGTLGWDYDSRDRVTNEAGSRPGLMGSASYDGADNLLSKGANGWTYNANNQVTPSSGQWAYDGNGNATKFRTRDCTFDPFDRMTTMREADNWSVGYTYRADGLMATRAKTIYILDEESGGWLPLTEAPTYFYHDGGEPIVELSSTNQVKAINVRGPDGLVARKHGTAWIYYTFDQQGSVSQRLNSNGVVQSTSAYSAYGSELNTVAPTDPFGYCAQWGYWLDRDTGLYLCQARWYDPVTGRWVNRDPIGHAGGANLYGYCGGGPVGGADPSGLRLMEGYWANVGQVFLGYADALNPVNAIVGAYGAGCAFVKGISEGDCLIGHRLSGAMATELAGGIFQLDDPRRFGSSFMGALLTVAPLIKGVRAPNVGGMGIAPEIGAARTVGTATGEAGVYVLLDSENAVRYVGRTNDFVTRAYQHGRDLEKGGPRLERVYRSADPIEQTIMEQLLINENGGIGGGQLLNKINAVNKRSPLYKQLKLFRP